MKSLFPTTGSKKLYKSIYSDSEFDIQRLNKRYQRLRLKFLHEQRIARKKTSIKQ